MGLALVVGAASCRQVFGIDDPSTGDAGSSGDSPVAIDATTCTAATVDCIGANTLRTCSGPGVAPMIESCDWGCLPSSASDSNSDPHCGVLQPQGGAVTPADLQDMSALADLALSGATINTSDGSILVGSTQYRAPGLGVIAGVDYEVRGKVAVFRASSVVLGQIALTGAYSVALVANGDITITGDVDARGACTDKTGGPGGGNGGASRSGGVGTGGGAGGNSVGDGGGGGGYGAVGGAGGTGTIVGSGPNGGPAYGDAAIITLVGGSGGGSSGAQTLALAARGGGGGGGVQLVSNRNLTITGTINAGGCGGVAGAGDPSGGGGGGGGGTVLLEAPMIILVGTVAANGGGGGGGGPGSSPGANASADDVASIGGASNHGDGGAGGNAAHPGGNPGANNTTYSGGGGGAVGRLRFETRGGTVNGFGTTSPTPVTATATVK